MPCVRSCPLGNRSVKVATQAAGLPADSPCLSIRAWLTQMPPAWTTGGPISSAPTSAVATVSGRLGELSVRIDDEFARDAGVEGFVPLWRLLKTDHLDVDDLGDRQSIPKDRLHELPVVFQHWRLARV